MFTANNEFLITPFIPRYGIPFLINSLCGHVTRNYLPVALIDARLVPAVVINQSVRRCYPHASLTYTHHTSSSSHPLPSRCSFLPISLPTLSPSFLCVRLHRFFWSSRIHTFCCHLQNHIFLAAFLRWHPRVVSCVPASFKRT